MSTNASLGGERFAALLAHAHVDRLALGQGRTPFRLLPSASERTGATIWVKDEGRAGPLYGGNKVRKLELLLQGVRAGEAVLTWGPAGSHHVLATMLYARSLGAHAVAVLVGEPAHDDARKHRRWIEQSGAEVIRTHPAFLVATLARVRARGPIHFVPAGGSDDLGTLGTVGLGLELAEDLADEPTLDGIFVPLGTGGTAAGLSLGLGLAGRSDPVLAIQVAPALYANRTRVDVLAWAAARRLQVPRSRAPVVVVRGHFAPGYGLPSTRGEAAARRALDDGMVLEPTYGAKTFGALLDRVRDAGRYVFVQTASTVDPS